MRICQVVPSLEERHGGPSKSVAELCSGLAAAGHEVELLTTSPAAPSIETAEGGRLTIRTFHRDWPERLCRSSGLSSHLARLDADVVHHHSLWLRTLHYAHRACVRSKAPLVVSPRGMMADWAWQHRRGRKHLAARLIHPGALAAVSGWHVTSDGEAGEVRRRGFAQPICLAPNGVAAPDTAASEAAAAHWRKVCRPSADRPVALFYSRFHRKKRVLELIDLWMEEGPKDWLLLIAGIPEEYTPESLEDYIQRSGGGDSIAIFSGARHPPPYPVASLFLLPSHNENFGMTVAEALSHGVPALVTDTTPWKAMEAAGAGWCVPWEGFAAALKAAVAEGTQRLRERGARARAWVLREYAWDRPIHLLEAFYQSLQKRK